MFNEIKKLRNGIKVVVTSEKDSSSHPGKFSIWEKELMKTLEPCVVEPTFNPSIWGREELVDLWAWGQSGLPNQSKVSQALAVRKNRELVKM